MAHSCSSVRLLCLSALIQHPNADVHTSTNAQKAMHTYHASRFQLMQQKIISLPSLSTPPCVVDVVPPCPVGCHGLMLVVVFCPVAVELVAVQVVSVNSVLQSLIPLYGSHNILVIAIVLLGGRLPISVIFHHAVIANIGR